MPVKALLSWEEISAHLFADVLSSGLFWITP